MKVDTIMQNWSKMNNDDLYRLVCEWLALPPAAAGIRLISERDLSEKIGIPRKRLRTYLDKLIEEGIVVRRHGSGNYLRRVPKISGPRIWQKDAPPIQLFSNDKPDPKLVPMPNQKQLHIGVWSGFHRMPSPNSSILKGIEYEASLASHKTNFCSIYDSENRLLSADQLARLIEKENVDGHIVSHGIAALFQEALSLAMGTDWLAASVLYVAPFYTQVTCEPIIRLDLLEAMERAIHILSNNSYKRIAVISTISEYYDTEAEKISYEKAISTSNLSYTSYSVGPPEVGYGYETVIRLLRASDPPDAIYVANDKLAQGIDQALRQCKCYPPINLGLISLSNRDNTIPEKLGWSRLEFDPFLLGRISLSSLVREIITSHAEAHSLSLLARWFPQKTHMGK